MLEGNLQWVGDEGRQIAFCFESDRGLMWAEAEKADEASDDEAETDSNGEAEKSQNVSLFPHPYGRYDFATLLRASQLSASALAGRLWEEVWKGRATNDTFVALRRGIQNKFKAPEVPSIVSASGAGRRPGRRLDFARWRGSMPFAGNWYPLPSPETADDLLEIEERNKDRGRLLLERYGVLFRELLQREAPALRWSSVFRSLRIMELSGEVLAGCFFHGIPGPQFISHQAFRALQGGLSEDAVYFINATDPASLCGATLDALRGKLPRRMTSTHLVYHGRNLMMVSERNGKTLTFNAPPDHPRLQEYLCALRRLLTREFQPMRRITVETINEQDASRSPYVDALRASFEVAIDFKHVILYRKRG
jgi:ATP-dependent Lhr-like helicase